MLCSKGEVQIFAPSSGIAKLAMLYLSPRFLVMTLMKGLVGLEPHLPDCVGSKASGLKQSASAL